MKIVGDLCHSERAVFFMPMRVLFLTACLFVVDPGWISAAKPAVTGLFPAGGQIGQTVEVEVLGKLGSAPVEVWCDREEVSAKPTKDGKKLQVAISQNAAPGICWLRVWNVEGVSSPRPFLVGRLPEVLEKEPNDSLEQAQTVDSAGCVVNGKLHKSGELDTFKVLLKQGQTLVADVLANQVLNSPMDAVLQIASDTGFPLAQADDSPRFDPRLAFTAPKDGTYFVRVFAFPATPNSSIRYAGGADYVYRLTLTTGPYARFTLPLSSTNGETSLQLKGWNIPDDAPPLKLPADSEDLTPLIPFPAVVPLEVSAWDHASFLESNSKPTTYAAPFSITGTIAEADETDRYRIAAKKGDSLLVQIKSAALGFPLDPVLEIQDAQGKSLKVVDDKSRGEADAEYAWKVPADGEYQILVSDRFGHGGWDYAYLLTVETPKPEFSLSVAADAFALTKDKALEIPVNVAKSNGFAEKTEVDITGLPAGFTVETGKTEAGKESRSGRRRGRSRSQNAETIKLKITAKGDQPFHGPVWITAKDGGKTISANTPTANLSAQAKHVWITYQPKK